MLIELLLLLMFEISILSAAITIVHDNFLFHNSNRFFTINWFTDYDAKPHQMKWNAGASINSLTGARADRFETKTETADRTDWFSVLSSHHRDQLKCCMLSTRSNTRWNRCENGKLRLRLLFYPQVSHKLRRSSSADTKQKFSWQFIIEVG